MVCYSCFCSLCIFILLLIDLIHRLLLGRGIGRAGLLSKESRAGRTVGDQHRSKASGSTLRLSSCLLIKQPFFIKCKPRLTLRVLGGKGSPVWVTTKQRYKWENFSAQLRNSRVFQVDENMPWGSDALFTLQFVEESKRLGLAKGNVILKESQVRDTHQQ